MLDRLRGRVGAYLDGVGKAFARSGLSPTAWTLVGLGLALFAGLEYYIGGYWGGVIGGALILVAGWFDIVDGAVARVTSSVSKRGAFLDSTFDRVAEVGIFAGVLAGGFAPPLLVLAALAGSLLVSYTRARGDALGVALSGVGIGERSERLLVLAVASILGFVYWGVALVTLLAWLTFLERTYRAATAL